LDSVDLIALCVVYAGGCAPLVEKRLPGLEFDGNGERCEVVDLDSWIGYGAAPTAGLACGGCASAAWTSCIGTIAITSIVASNAIIAFIMYLQPFKNTRPCPNTPEQPMDSLAKRFDRKQLSEDALRDSLSLNRRTNSGHTWPDWPTPISPHWKRNWRDLPKWTPASLWL